MKFRLLLLAVLLFSLTLAVTAQDGSPAESPLENACYAGGSQEGKCDWPTAAEDEWAWTCGWYIARADNGTIALTDVPEWCNYFTNPSNCFQAFLEIPDELEGIPGFPDLQVTGALGTLGNAKFHVSFDGSCSGEEIPVLLTVITAPLSEEGFLEAFETCEGLYGSEIVGVLPIIVLGYATPENWWLCFPLDGIDLPTATETNLSKYW